jgi:hypothetical protein
MTPEERIEQGKRAVAEMSAAIKDLQKLRDQKEAETMRLQREKEKAHG